jgi:hypothetical protein
MPEFGDLLARLERKTARQDGLGRRLRRGRFGRDRAPVGPGRPFYLGKFYQVLSKSRLARSV